MNTPSFWGLEVDTQENWAYADNVFTKEECAKIIKIGNDKLQPAKVFGNNQDIRESQIAWLYPNDNMEWVFRKITDHVTSLNNQFFNFDLAGFGEGFQFTKYVSPTGHYGKHIDKIIKGHIRKLSLTIQLSDNSEYEGGELILHLGDKGESKEHMKEQGKLIAFPSYVLHEVKPVTKGTRYSLVAWITGKPFK